MKVLIIEDSQRVIKDISFSLKVRYPEVNIISVSEGTRGVDVVETEAPDLVMIDSSLSNMDLVNLIVKIRESFNVPIIILYEAETAMDRARGLEAGADEYIIKPFSSIELLARVRALLRRTQGDGFKLDRMVNIGEGLTIDFTTREVFLSGKRVNLTPIEYKLLAVLVRNNGKVLSHNTLLEKVWGPEYDTDNSFVKKYIYRLRSKLELDASKPQMLLTERGIGYRFVKPV